MYLATLFKISLKWKQPKCPSTDECINKIAYLHIILFINEKEVLKHAMIWMNFENTVLSEQRQEHIICESHSVVSN